MIGGIDVRVEVIGSEELAAELRRKPAEAAIKMDAALWSAGQLIRNHIVDKIRSGPKSGRFYKRGKRRLHRASAQGEYPAADTGNLMKRVQTKRVPGRIAVDVESGAAYAEPLEFKAPSRGGRPHLTRGYDEKIEEALAMIRVAIASLFGTDGRATRR